jgi:hypothetical protein
MNTSSEEFNILDDSARKLQHHTLRKQLKTMAKSSAVMYKIQNASKILRQEWGSIQTPQQTVSVGSRSQKPIFVRKSKSQIRTSFHTRKQSREYGFGLQTELAQMDKVLSESGSKRVIQKGFNVSRGTGDAKSRPGKFKLPYSQPLS